MAVTILNRPEGIILGSAVSATIDDNGGGGQLRIIKTSHGLTTGDKIYIESDVEDYNGFWIVGVLTSSTFLISADGVGANVQYISGSTLTYYASVYNHGWSCVHLPITYRLSNDLYPTNSADTSRTVNSVQDANGYTVILISGSLGSGVNSYDFVKLTVPLDTELSGVYQILEFISPTVMIINLLYDSTNNFSGATALKHYNNYNIQVRVYAGINSSHQWTAQKPYELAATLEFIPDEDNEVFFSINELLKSYIETRNNLVLGTLPNNIDFWTNFYIEYAESYDDSDGYTFGTNQGNFTSDLSTFEGTAVNAKLEFKNLQSGYLSEYLMTNNTAKFLTLFTIPVLFQCGDDTPDCYSDISFLNPVNNAVLTLRKQFYSNGNGPVTVETSLGTSLDSGVIRAELSPDCSYDRVDLTVMYNAPDIDNSGEYTNSDTGVVDWVSFVSTLNDVVGTSSEFLCIPFIYHAGVTYTITYQITLASSGAWDQVTFFASFAKAKGTDFTDDDATDSDLYNTTGVKNGTFTLTPTVTRYGFLRFRNSIGILGTPAEGILTINSISISFTAQAISETKQFKIDCDCCTYEIRLSWLNNLGAMEPTWVFCGKKDDVIEIQEAMTTKKNLLPTWPKSFG